MVNRIGKLKLFRWKDGTATLQLTEPGYSWRAPKLPRWTVFFVGHYGQDKTVWTYKR